MSVEVRIRFGHLDRMPKCKHGRIEGYCSVCDPQRLRPIHPDWQGGER